MGDGPSHLTHYDPTGTKLGDLDLTGTVGEIFDIEMAGSDLWLLDYPARGAQEAYLVRVHTDGQVVLRHTYNLFQLGNLETCFLKGVCGLVLGGNGELLADMGGHPLLLADAAGNVQDLRRGESLLEYPGWPHHYATELVLGNGGQPNVGRVTVDGKPITVTMSSSVQSLGIVTARPDGSFYLAVGEGDQTISGGNFTLFYYGADGAQRWGIHLVDRASYGILLHRLALGPDGAVYFLMPGSVDLVEVHRVSGTSPTDLPPTLVFPTATPLPPTASPTPPWSVARLASEAAVIVEVAIMPGYPQHDRGWEPFKVVQWLKEPEDWKDPQIQRPEVIGVSPPENVAREQWPGEGRFVLFLQPRSGWCEGWNDFYTVLGDLEGVFPIEGEHIGAAALPGYTGWTLAAFKAALAMAPAKQVPTPAGDVAFQQLVQMVQHAEMIADADFSWREPGAGMAFYSLKIRKWYKTPVGLAKETLGAQTDTCAAHRIGLGSAHFITFLSGVPQTNINQVFGVTNGVIEYGPIGHYWGWPVGKFEAELQTALAVPYVAAPATQQLLARLVRDSDQIVRITSVGASPTVKVLQWLKPGAQPAGTDLLLHESLDYDRYAAGEYLLFLRGRQEIVRLDNEPGFGIFPVHGDTIGWGGIPDYAGWPLATFEDAIRTLLATPP